MGTLHNPPTKLVDGVFSVNTPAGFQTVGGAHEFYVPATAFLTHTGSGALTGTAAGSGSFPGWALDTTTDEVLSTAVMLPDSWPAFKADVVWSNSSTGAGGVRWNINYELLAIGAARGAGTDVAATGTASTTAFLLVKTLVILEATAVAQVADAFLAIKLSRDADHAADTLANDAQFHGLIITKVG
jgi:hypothetical protein